MREYFTVLFLVCILSGVISTLTPSESLKKYIEYLCAVCVTCCMVIPVAEIFPLDHHFSDIFDGYDKNEQSYEEIYNSFWASEDERAAVKALSEGLAKKIGVESESFYVELCVSGTGESRVLEGIRFYVTDLAAISVDPDIVRAYFRDVAGAECEIIYDLEG